MKFRLIDAEKATTPVSRLCGMLGVSVSGTPLKTSRMQIASPARSMA